LERENPVWNRVRRPKAKN